MDNPVEVHVTYDPMEANLIKAKLTDEDIPFNVTGDSNVTMTMETFNSSLSRMALKQPIKFFVEQMNYENALAAINTDRSSMLGDDLEY
jgi:hypothetical protein